MSPKLPSTLRLLKEINRDGGPFLFHQQVANDKKGITRFLKELRQQIKTSLGQCLFCMEFTGIYNNPLLKALHQQSANIVRRQVKVDKRAGPPGGENEKRQFSNRTGDPVVSLKPP